MNATQAPRSARLRAAGWLAVLFLSAVASAYQGTSSDRAFRECFERGHIAPDCVRRDADERARVGTFCSVHPGERLRPDIVRIHFGIVGYTPGLNVEEAKQFPNARVWESAGCVIGRPYFAEVAYCPECRRVWSRAMKRATAFRRHDFL